jgi:ATP-binding protein involved in chromosome partitioning
LAFFAGLHIMADITEEAVLGRLRLVKGPDLKDDLVTLGLVSDIIIEGGKVTFSISIDPRRAAELEPLRQAAAKAVGMLPGVESTLVILTAEAPAGNAPAPKTSPVASAPSRPDARAIQPPPPAPSAPRPRQAPGGATKAGVPGVESIIAVASGKGGVGKSTTAVNLALGLAQNGLRVGILDADVYGPSLPRLLNISGRPEPLTGRLIRPKEAYGLRAMSMGLLVDEEAPMIWRGPMVVSALTQLLREVAWGDLDVLVVDMPPGTGDAQLTMAQQVPLAGAVIVSTPQDLALIDARKGLAMFQRVDVPVLGIVENMSYFICPHCGERSELFGHGGARHEAERLGVPFLGEVPLDMAIRTTSDAGTPIVAAEPEGKSAAIYRAIARNVQDQLALAKSGRAPPRIVIED